MSKGRKTMPAKIHHLHGTFREDRHGEEMKVQTILPDPPDRLDVVARAEWTRLAAELHKVGIMSALDITTLEIYCTVYSRWLHAEGKVAESNLEGAVSRTPNGYQQQSAWLQIANNCIKQLQSLAGEFGLTPATRARMRLIASQPKQISLLELLDQASKERAAANG